MIIKDEGYVLNAKKYGEKALIVTLFSLNKGKITGFVSDGLMPKNRGIFQIGNKIFFEASARLEENMRRLYRIELIEPNAVMMMTDIKRLELMSAVLPIMLRILNENEQTDELYEIIGKFFKAKDIKEMLTWYAYFEFSALAYLGIGLELESCAVTGQTENLAYVSPKTGKAVCQKIGAPYHDRLFLYPHFVVDKNTTPSYAEIFNVLRMTEFFLRQNFFKFHNLPMPKTRETLWQFYELREDTAPAEKSAVGF